ncbi:MFS transporter [Homoserinimonas sp. A520]
MTQPSNKLWTVPFVLSMAISFFVGMVFYVLVTSMAIYAVDEFRASQSAAGLAAGGFVLGALVSRIFAGKFLDFVGRRRMLLIGLCAFVISAALYLVADNLVLLIGIRLLHGAAFGVAHTAITSSVMTIIPAHRRGEGTGYYGVSNVLVTALGPFVAILLIERASYDALFVFSTICSATALTIALFLRMPERTPTPEEVATKWRMRFTDILDPAALAIGSVMLVTGIAYSGVLTFLNSYALDQGMVGGAAGFFLVYAGTVLVSRLFVGRFQDRYGDNAVIYPTLASFTVGMVMLSLAPNSAVMVLAGVFIGFGHGSLMPCAQAIAVTVVPRHRVGVAISTFFVALDAGTGLGPILLGAVIAFSGFQGMYLAMAALVLASALLYHFVHGFRRYRRPPLPA